MVKDLIEKKYQGKELNQAEYYEVVDAMLMHCSREEVIKFFYSVNYFGMTKREVLYLTKALRDSGKVVEYDQCVFEKHSTGGIGDSTSVVLVPLLASLGYKVIKTTAKSFMFTNGSADRFGAIPNFKVTLDDKSIVSVLDKTNACVLSHDGVMCPADKILHELRETCDMEEDINLLAASIASKKLASGADVVLVDVKYGFASTVKSYSQAKKMAKLLKYIFKKCNVKCIVVITNTFQTIGEGIGNAAEVVDAVKVLQGRRCKLRDVSVLYALEMIMASNKRLNKKDVLDMINTALDNGAAYEQFLQIVKAQGGDEKAVKEAKLFIPYKSVNFVADRSGYVGSINSLLMGEIVRRLCADSHDDNIGVVLRVKIGDYVKKGDIIVSFYYKNDKDLAMYKNAISGCVRVTESKICPVNVVRKVIR